MERSEEASFSEFASLARFKPGYVTELRKAGRLVLTADGKRVRVAESLALIASTADPSRQAVADRHAAARQAAESPDDDQEPTPAPTPEQMKYQFSRAEREHWNAQAARRDYELSMRQLLPAAEVESAIADTVTQLRARLEALPDILAPQLAAEPDEAKCRTLLADEIEHALTELARGMGNIAKAELH